MATTILRERNIAQSLANRTERLVEGHFVKDAFDGTIAIAFVPTDGGHTTQYRLTKRQVNDLRKWLNTADLAS